MAGAETVGAVHEPPSNDSGTEREGAGLEEGGPASHAGGKAGGGAAPQKEKRLLAFAKTKT